MLFRSQVVEGAINMVFKGDARPSSRRRSSVNASRVSYSNFYDERRGGSSRRSSRYDEPRRSTRLSYDDVSFETREDANEVLNAMDDIVEEYGVVRVADLFELGGFTGNGSTDHDYGWTTTKTASVERDRDGKFYIKIGRPSPIK